VANAINGMSPFFPAVYRFLAALSTQAEGVGGSFSWGPLGSLPRLPRVEYQKSVLAPATWNIEYPPAGSPNAEQFVAALREKWHVPRHVALVVHDSWLPLDLDSSTDAALLVHEMRRGSVTQLVEDLAAHGNLVVESPEGRFRHDLIVPFLGRNRQESRIAFVPELHVDASVRHDAPGGRVIYSKLYVSPRLQNALIPRLAHIGRTAVVEKRAASFHFLRCHDPEPHLRFRLLNVPPDARSRLLDELHEIAADERSRSGIWRMQLDTYHRELERYGGVRGIVLAERCFHIDSVACAGLVEYLSGCTEDEWDSVQFFSTYQLLVDLLPSMAARLDVLEQLETGYAAEQRIGRIERRVLGERYRRHERWFASLLQHPSGVVSAHVASLVSARSAALSEVWPDYRAILDTQGDGAVTRVVESLVHLHACRLRGHDVRHIEFVLYTLLRKATQRSLARSETKEYRNG
jgi:lantibiotic biosynthesis protein